MPLVLVIFAAASVSVFLIVLLRHFAPFLGLIDRPDARKRHEGPVPVVGGIAMFLAFMSFAYVNTPHPAFSLAAALALLVAIGLIDDRAHLGPKTRLLAEIAAATLLVVQGCSVHYLGDLLGNGGIYTGGIHAALFTLVCFVGLTNAINMADGLDGLAGLLSLVAITWFTAIALVMNDMTIASVGATAAGVLIGFLGFNLRTPWRMRASVFMGDAGSMVLGFLLAWFAVELAGRGPDSLISPIGAVWIMAVPLLDMGTVMLSRMRRGFSPFRPDRRHIHHILVDRGVPVGKTVMLITAAGAGTGALGVFFPRLGIPESVMFFAFLGVWALWYAWANRLHVNTLDVEVLLTSKASLAHSLDRQGMKR